MSDFLKKWDRILSWEVANYPLSMLRKKELHALPFEAFEEELDRMAHDYNENRYRGGSA
ncbi:MULTISPECIES: hypothetical protein [unclassified Streptococcus]|uniref:hypothetical protein n=1 Tax=unclassified Streptococcus TaxID=2608887 RepID=UPI00211B6ADA|nr:MULTISPECIES: hypothetical protein [unclassified Streptococcus]MCQ9211634.1 hypothetical protein [Streptococcus sp. B01]MCQ9213152.1 hypothetical protein [Streptococcus sp. O1]MCQ9214941.1 hypothetical protein [Streptococcus sp. O1]MCQ9215073.1 hypothetical protein [Streptococcus sp. O1]